ncbi:hypothetical protein ACFOD5_04920, partial [Luteimonas padinae]
PTPIPTGPIAVAFLTIACLALAWLALTREDRLDALRDVAHVPAQDIDVSARMAAPLPRVLADVDAPAPAPAEMPAAEVMAAAALAADVAAQTAAAEAQSLVQPPEAADWPTPATTPTPAPSPTPTPTPTPLPVGAATAATHPTTTTPVDDEGVGEEVAAIAAPTGAGVGGAGVGGAGDSGAGVGGVGDGGAATEDPVRLFRDAEAALDSVTAWFASERGGEPFWLDLPVSLEAAAIRHDLHARHAPAARSRMAIVQPNWTLGSGTASVSGAYRLHGRRGTVETGMLSVQLARRGEHWRIARLHLEPAR